MQMHPVHVIGLTIRPSPEHHRAVSIGKRLLVLDESDHLLSSDLEATPIRPRAKSNSRVLHRHRCITRSRTKEVKSLPANDRLKQQVICLYLPPSQAPSDPNLFSVLFSFQVIE